MTITELDIGGAERAFVQIAAGLQRLGWDVDVVSLRNTGALAAELQCSGVDVTALGCGSVADLRAVTRLRRHFLQRQPDIVLSFLYQANLMSRLAARLAGIRRVVSGVRVADRRLVVTIPERLTNRWVSLYLAVSHNVAKVHREVCRIDPNRIVPILNGVDVEAIQAAVAAERSAIQCSATDFVILCAGRLSEQKAPLDVLNAFRQFCQAQPVGTAERRPILVFAGEGPLRDELRQKVAAWGVEDQVRLLGQRTDLWSLMKCSNVLVLASRWEGLPNVILEAQAALLPVIASAVDGTTELIVDGQTGRLFEAGNVTQLTQRMQDCLSSETDCRRLAAQAFESVRSATWHDCVAAYDQVLRKLLSDERLV